MEQPVDEQRSCHGKKRYADAEVANAVAAKCYAERGEYLRVYPCELCGGHHLTHVRVEVRDGWRPPRPSQRAAALQRQQSRRRRRGRKYP